MKSINGVSDKKCTEERKKKRRKYKRNEGKGNIK
jgi:hypothetical protein